jgi:hypothetical protein
MTGSPTPRTFKVELDRRAAIRLAIDWMGPEDVLIIAGKGHETYQIIGRQKHRFDDREEARRILAGMPPPPPLAFDDGTSEVDSEQVVETLEIVDTSAIISETSDPKPVTESVEPESIVSSVDIEGVEVLSENDVEEIPATPAAPAAPAPEASVTNPTPTEKKPDGVDEEKPKT